MTQEGASVGGGTAVDFSVSSHCELFLVRSVDASFVVTVALVGLYIQTNIVLLFLIVSVFLVISMTL